MYDNYIKLKCWFYVSEIYKKAFSTHPSAYGKTVPDIIAKTQMIIYRHKLFYTKYIGLKHIILLKFNKLKID